MELKRYGKPRHPSAPFRRDVLLEYKLPPPNPYRRPDAHSLWREKLIQLAEDRGQTYQRLRSLVVTTIVAQMLPPSVVKGGTSMILRSEYGDCRQTDDIDVARPKGVEIGDFLDELKMNLRRGWNGYTGEIELSEMQPMSMLPSSYIMQHLTIALSHNGSYLLTVPMEIGSDEIGETEKPDLVLTKETSSLFALLSLPATLPGSLLPVPYQIAQKLHGCTSLHGRKRANDLVDMQILMRGNVSLRELRLICEQMFPFRRQHEFPPDILIYPEWRGTYESAARGLNVVPTLGEAVAWTERLISDIDSS